MCDVCCVQNIKIPLLTIRHMPLSYGCLTPVQTTSQLRRCGEFHGWRTLEYQEKTTNLLYVTDKRLHIKLYVVRHAMNANLWCDGIVVERQLSHVLTIHHDDNKLHFDEDFVHFVLVGEA